MKINELNNLDFGDDEWIYQKDLRLLQELIVVLNHFSKEFQSETLVKKIKFIKKTNSDILRKVFLSPEGRQYITLCYLAIKFNDSNPIVKNYSWLTSVPHMVVLMVKSYTGQKSRLAVKQR